MFADLHRFLEPWHDHPALAPAFHWLLAFHIISFTAWMAGMFYLPRLYVYHCQTTPGTAESERFKVMEVKLLRLIINPAMIATWIFGILLILTPVPWTGTPPGGGPSSPASS